MRIIAGKLKGTVLHMPKNKNTRPLKDLTRESIFNLLIHSNKISLQLEESNILDLYAGTGSFGLECLSRQAKSVCFVEKGKDATLFISDGDPLLFETNILFAYINGRAVDLNDRHKMLRDKYLEKYRQLDIIK